MNDLIKIEQRLQDPARILFFSLDEALAFGIPLFLGMMTKQLIPFLILGVVIFLFWRKLKGDGGILYFYGLMYWFMPQKVSYFRSFPDSGEERFIG